MNNYLDEIIKHMDEYRKEVDNNRTPEDINNLIVKLCANDVRIVGDQKYDDALVVLKLEQERNEKFRNTLSSFVKEILRLFPKQNIN